MRTAIRQDNITATLTVTVAEREPFLDQYCNLSAEWKERGINIDTAPKGQVKRIQDLRAKATAQSGLTDNELTLINVCRQYGIFTEVNTFMFQLLRSIEQRDEDSGNG